MTTPSAPSNPEVHRRNVVVNALYWTRVDGIKAASDTDAIAQALHRVGEVAVPGTGVPVGLPFGRTEETPCFRVEQVDAQGNLVAQQVYGEDGCEPATPQRAEFDARIAEALPEPAPHSYDRGFRDALASVIAHLASSGVMTHLQTRELVDTVLDAFGNNADESERVTRLVIGEDGTCGEPAIRTVAAFEDSASADDYRHDCWEHSHCWTAEPIEVPAQLQPYKQALVQLVESALIAEKALQPYNGSTAARSPAP
mgnify:FL=1